MKCLRSFLLFNIFCLVLYSQQRGLPLRNLVRHLSEHLSTVQVAKNASLPGPKLARRLPLDLAVVLMGPVVRHSLQLGLRGRNDEYISDLVVHLVSRLHNLS